VDGEKIAPLYYLQVTENIRPDLDLLVQGNEALYRQELDRRIGEGQPVYLARFLPNLPYRMRSLGPLVEVSGSPVSGSSVSGEPSSTAPAIGRKINAAFGDQIELLGIDEVPGQPYRFTLYWQATSPERKNYHVRLRLVDTQGNVWWEDPGAHPVGGYYPTGAWVQDEVVSDFHEAEIESFVPSGAYDLEVGLFTPFRSDGLKLQMAATGCRASVRDCARLSRWRSRRAYLGQRRYLPDELSTVPPESPVALRLQAGCACRPLP
jgi:hypothetical protein